MPSPTDERRRSAEIIRRVESDPRHIAARVASKTAERELINAKNAFVRATNADDKDAIVQAALAVTNAGIANNDALRAKQETFKMILEELDRGVDV